MKAVMFHNADTPISLESVADPTPGPGEMILRVGRCGICGSDVHLIRENGWFPENCVLGHEFAGEVVELGAGVTDFRIGDVVTSMPSAGCGTCEMCVVGHQILCQRGSTPYMGGFAEYVRVAARSSIRLPSSLSLADGALVEPLAVALHGFNESGVVKGARVLVLGAGAIGLGAIYWAKQLGASRVAALSRSMRRAELALTLGADSFVQGGEDEAERAAAALGGPPDLVVECIGVPGALAQSVRLVRQNGMVTSLGFSTKADPLIPALATVKQVKLNFAMAYTLPEFQTTVDTLERGHVEPRAMISKVIALDDVPEMIEALRQGATEVKVMAAP